MVWFTQAAAQRVDGVDQFYEPSREGRRSRALALAMAMRNSRRQPLRTFCDWQVDGRYELFGDGWMSQAHAIRLSPPADASVVTVSGRNQAIVRRPLVIWAKVNGSPAAALVVRGRGPFTFEVPLPRGLHGRDADVELRSLWTWRPRSGGDLWRLSCLIDSVEVA